MLYNHRLIFFGKSRIVFYRLAGKFFIQVLSSLLGLKVSSNYAVELHARGVRLARVYTMAEA